MGAGRACARFGNAMLFDDSREGRFAAGELLDMAADADCGPDHQAMLAA
jgi:hypothetical protein